MPRFALLVRAAIAWAATLGWSRSMGNGPGTAGLGWGDFLGIWAVMMAAMMLPTIWHEIPHQAAARQQRLLARTIALVAGYLSVWAATGVAALALATGAEYLAGTSRRHRTPRCPTPLAAPTAVVVDTRQPEPQTERGDR